VLALADCAKALVANASNDLRQVRLLLQASMFIVAFFMVVWVAVAPGFEGFARFLNDDSAIVAYAVTAFGIVFVPYVIFSFNTVMDAFFYGLGRTEYLAYQAIITNGTVYLVAFLLYVTGVWAPSFEGVMVLFSIGIVVDSVFTVAFLLKILYLDQPRAGLNLRSEPA
jgi:Na+-driven multidrug efflux pump